MYKRVPISGTADVIVNDPKGQESIKTIVSNVSLSGLGLYADRQIGDETDVSIDLNFLSTDEVMKYARVKGSIVYSREIGTFYFCGIEFAEEISADKQEDLYNYIQQALKWY